MSVAMSGERNEFSVAPRCVCAPVNGCSVVGTSFEALTVIAARLRTIGALSPAPLLMTLPHTAPAVAVLFAGCQNPSVATAGAASGAPSVIRPGGGVAQVLGIGAPAAALDAAYRLYCWCGVVSAGRLPPEGATS